MRVRSLRLRLTLWYLAILAAVLLAFSSAIYVTMRRSLNEALTDSVISRAALADRLIVERGSVLELPASFGESDPDPDDTFYRLYGPSGSESFDNSDRVGGVREDRGAVERALAGARSTDTIDGPGMEARVVTQPVVRNGSTIGVLQVGESTEDVNDTLSQLLLILAVAGPAALLLSTAGGWWLASRALSPIDRITRAAADIGEHDLSRRLALDLPDDEVGRLARTFDAMIARLDGAFRRQRQFTADASHELRTPLTAIRGQVDVALQRPRDATEYQRTLAAVGEQADRMARLSEGLLLLARTDAGSSPFRREAVPARALVEAAAERARGLAESRGLRLDVDHGPDVTLHGDEGLLSQLTFNLLDNAVKYTPAGAVTIGWRVDGDIAELFVRDTGPGIPPEMRERVFERFYRVEQSRSRDEGGSGLGLAICKSIAEAHGGSIRIEDGAEGRGTTFVVRLPIG